MSAFRNYTLLAERQEWGALLPGCNQPHFGHPYLLRGDLEAAIRCPRELPAERPKSAPT
jgi:hypothetical protein